MTPESVLEQKENVEQVVRDTYALAQQLGDNFEGMDVLKEGLLQDALPFCYAAFGEKGVGKTTLLSLISEGAHWETPEDAVKSGCVLWCYTPSSARWKKTQPGGVIERYVAVPALKKAVLMDSAPSDDPAVMEQVASATSQADAIFLLFQEENPLCPETWFLADRFQTNGYRNVVLVLTKYRGSSFDARDILTRMQGIARERWGYSPPAVAVSTEESEKEGSLIKLHKAAAGLLSVSLLRSTQLKSLLTETDILIKSLKSVVSVKDLAMRQDGGFLQTLEWEVDCIRAAEAQKVDGRCQSMGEIASEFLPKVMQAAAKKLGYYPSLLRLINYRRYPVKIDEWFFMVLGKALEARLESYDMEFVAQCRAHWEDVRPRALTQLNCEIGEFPEEALEHELALYREHVRRSLYRPLVDFKLRAFLVLEFAKRESWVRTLISFCLGVFSVACIFAFVGLYGPAYLLWMIAFFVWMGGAYALFVSRRNLLECSAEMQERFGEVVSQGLRPPLEKAVLCSVSGYRGRMEAIHSQISLTREALIPIQDRLSHVYKTCYALNNQIR